MADPRPARRAGRLAALLLLGWLAGLGVDLFFHGGLLARMYLEPSPFLLPPSEAFRLIPLGYLSLLILFGFLLWVLIGLGRRGWRQGLWTGAITGAVIGASIFTGMLSITSASTKLLQGWFLSYMAELAMAGAVMGTGLGGFPLRGLALKILLIDVILFVVTVIMQNLRLAPAVVL